MNDYVRRTCTAITRDDPGFRVDRTGTGARLVAGLLLAATIPAFDARAQGVETGAGVAVIEEVVVDFGTFRLPWGRRHALLVVLGDEVMAAALIDRLLDHCHIVNIRGKSYRMRPSLGRSRRSRYEDAIEWWPSSAR